MEPCSARQRRSAALELAAIEPWYDPAEYTKVTSAAASRMRARAIRRRRGSILGAWIEIVRMGCAYFMYRCLISTPLQSP